MKTIKIRRGSEHYPPGLNDLQDGAPDVLYVKGNVQALTQRSVTVFGSDPAAPTAHIDAINYAKELGAAGIVTVSDFSTLNKVSLDEAVKHGPAIAYFAAPLNRVAKDPAVANFLERGGTIVSLLRDRSRTPTHFTEIVPALAAHSPVVFVPEGDGSGFSMSVPDDAARLGRTIAVLEPLAHETPWHAGNRAFMELPGAVAIERNDVAKFLSVAGAETARNVTPHPPLTLHPPLPPVPPPPRLPGPPPRHLISYPVTSRNNPVSLTLSIEQVTFIRGLLEEADRTTSTQAQPITTIMDQSLREAIAQQPPSSERSVTHQLSTDTEVFRVDLPPQLPPPPPTPQHLSY
jgi:predicted Rossmann fold nucleotide-binding protein DprA/Smf involved in DNA uptake